MKKLSSSFILLLTISLLPITIGCDTEKGKSWLPFPIGTTIEKISVTKSIGPSGGTISADDGSWEMIIPAGALAAETEITIASNSIAAGTIPTEYTRIGTTFKFEPHGLTFSAPATFRFTYDQGTMPEGGIVERMQSFFYINDNSTVSEAPTAVYTNDNRVEASISHFSFAASLTLSIARVNSGAITDSTQVQLIANAVVDQFTACANDDARNDLYSDNIDLLYAFLVKCETIISSNPLEDAFPSLDFPVPSSGDDPAPVAVLFGEPPQTTGNDFMNTTVGGTGITAYKYSLDGAPWSLETDVSIAIQEFLLDEGSHTIEVIGKNSADEWQLEAEATTWTWTVDKTAPDSSEVALTGAPASLTNSTSISISVGGGDFVNYRYKLDSAEWTDPTGISTPITASGLLDGSHTLQVLVRDSAGNWQDFADPYEFTWTIDTVIESDFVINSGAANTDSLDVTLTISTGGGTEMRFSNDNSTWSTWEAISTSKSWSMEGPVGGKTVYGEFRDGANNEKAVQKTITYTPLSSDFVINGGATETTSADVTLTITAGGATEMRFSNDNSTWSTWEAVASDRAWTLEGDEGEKTVYGQFRDASANELYVQRDISFVPPKVWGTPELVEFSDNYVVYENEPDISDEYFAIDIHFLRSVVDNSGVVTAIWIQNDNTGYRSLYANRYTPGTGWDTPELVEHTDSHLSISGDIMASPSLAIDNSGIVTAIWLQSDGTAYSLYSNRYTPGSGWGTPELVEYNDNAIINASGPASPTLTVDSNGIATAVWVQADSTSYSLFSNRYTPGTGWGSPELVEYTDNYVATNGGAPSPAITVDSTDVVTAIWVQSDGTTYGLYSNRYTPGSGWGTPEYIDSPLLDNYNAKSPALTVDSNGTVTTVYIKIVDGNRNLYSNRYIPGTGWGTPELVENSDNEIHEGSPSPVIEVDSNNAITAIWVQRDSTTGPYSLYSNRYIPGTGWESPVLVENSSDGVPNSYGSPQPQLAIDSNNEVTAIWIQYDGTRCNVYSNKYISGSGWGTSELVENSDINLYINGGVSPSLVVDSNNDSTALWIQNDGTRYNVYSNRLE